MDDHGVDIGSKVTLITLFLHHRKKLEIDHLMKWYGVCGIGNYKSQGSEEVQRRRDATPLQHKERQPCHFWGYVSFVSHWGSEKEDQRSLGLVLLSLEICCLNITCNDFDHCLFMY